MTENSPRPGIDRPLRLGTRRSPLAMKQAEMAASELRHAHGWRRDQVELVPMVASGDKVQDRPLAEIGGKALWTRELDQALGTGEIDAAVHSMKDVETERPTEFLIGAILERADVRDRLIGAESIAALADGAIVGTASARRQAQLLHLRPDLQIVLLRGNVQTRLDKVASGEVEATLLAAAGLDRLDMGDTGVPIEQDEMLPAAAQGAIGIETLVEAGEVRRLLHAISHRNSFVAVMAERQFLAGLTADCHSPVAVQAEVAGTTISMRAQLLARDGSDAISGEQEFAMGEVSVAASFAQRLLGKAGEAVRAAFAG